MPFYTSLLSTPQVIISANFPQTHIQFENMYGNRATEENYTVHTAVAVLGFDAVWALATALNKTAAMVQSGNIRETGCEGRTEGDLVPLEHFNYSNGLMGCVIQWNLQNTNFLGASVSVKSDKKRKVVLLSLRR